MFKKYALAAVITVCTFITNAQNVGIGVEHPGSRLSVRGGISIGETYAEKPAPDGVILIEKSMGIGTDTIDPNVVLDIRSATKGVLFPTMSTSTIQGLSNPPKGLMVFNADSAGFNFYNGTSWINFALLGPNGPIGAAATLLGNITGNGGSAYGATATSVLPVSIATGTKIFTVPTNMSYRANDRVRVSNTASKYMEGTVVTYLAGILTVNVDRTVGSGSYTSWTVGITGDVGATGAQGIQGVAGTAGAQGPAGVAGAAGARGATGSTGAQGIQGPAGTAGAAGARGATGATGADGNDGAQGPQGVKGATGSTGAQGAQGIQGPAGVAGAQGVAGTAGAAGARGATGATGADGNDGAQGPQGVKGATGSTGVQGAQGIQGSAGAQGVAGTAGAAGARGATGATGAQGIQGVAGAQGIQGTAGAAGAAGARGATGATGADGADGIAAQWLSGNGNVGNGQGNVGDWYLRTGNGDVYEKTGSSTWTYRMNLTGPAGAAGSGGSGWGLSGTAASSGNFIGTTNAQPLIFKVNNNNAGYVGSSDNNATYGYQAGYTGSNNVGIGASSYVAGTNSVAVGYQAQAQANNGIAIGRASYVSQQYGVAMGDNAQAQANSGLALGKSSYVSAADGIAIGSSAQAQGSGIVIGKGAYLSASNGIVMGTSANVQAVNGIGIGKSVYVSGANAIALGESANAQGANSITIGNGIYNGNANTTAIGASTNTSVNFSGATSTSYALMVGTNNTNGNGAYLTKGGTWTNASDRNLKEDITNLNAGEILNKVAALDITQWRYKGTSEYHIGPMAQDFYAAFNLGGDDKRVSTIDPSGVALVAIQALNNKVEQQQKEIDELKKLVYDMRSK